jgi:cell division protein FtsL
MKKKLNLDYQSLVVLENAMGKEAMVEFLDKYQLIITQDKETEQYLKNLFINQKKTR